MSAARTLAALALQMAALVALGLALLGHTWLDLRHQPRVWVLVDRSQSMPRAETDQAIAAVVQAAAATQDLQLLEFAGKPDAPAAASSAAASALDPLATNIEAALEAALAAHAKAPLAGVVVISDGQENAGDLARALRAARAAGLPLQWLAVGRTPPPTRIAEVLAPHRALLGQRLQLTVQLAGALDPTLRIQASARSSKGDIQTASGQADADGRATLELEASHSGAMLVDVMLQEDDGGALRALDAQTGAAVIDVAPRASMLYVQGANGGTLASSLRRGGWALDVVAAARLDALADGLDGYRAIVLDNVAIQDAGTRFWRALVDAVQQRGLGLMVLGGERSFALGGYRQSALESVLPLLSEPASLDQPAAIMFVVDKSGSMGQSSGGVDRFALAQRAVRETARELSGRDQLGLLVFDVAPRLLLPLGDAAAGTLAIERDWQTSPSGGTKLAPALEAAIGELERAGAARRMLVVVTDGFLDDAPLAELRARLERARIETIALAVGPDADVQAMRRLIDPAAGQVLHVDQAAELPLAMRAGVERRRARVERGAIAVAQRAALPFAPEALQDWPAVAAHHVTRARAEAVVAVQSERGDPLLAFQRVGRGRVVALSCGLGPWTPQWLAWRAWPRLAGGLADWISGTPPGGAAALTVSDLPLGLQLEAEVPPGSDAGIASMAIAVTGPGTPGERRLTMDLVAPGRLRATLPDTAPGLYTLLSTTQQGLQRQLHLRRQRAESETWGLNPALDSWRKAGLIAAWRPGLPAPDREQAPRPPDRTLLALALALFVAGVLLDRLGVGAARTTARAWLQRWRTRPR
ncbi:VWA domain-containing protein [Paucibacter soli]|uniref:VWA domain-containing protein n=1 Tax=Paucibacter soli TaxID=3133433 RepID=UPI0030ADD63D